LKSNALWPGHNALTRPVAAFAVTKIVRQSRFWRFDWKKRPMFATSQQKQQTKEENQKNIINMCCFRLSAFHQIRRAAQQRVGQRREIVVFQFKRLQTRTLICKK
jgi:hypothetical protein